MVRSDPPVLPWRARPGSSNSLQGDREDPGHQQETAAGGVGAILLRKHR